MLRSMAVFLCSWQERETFIWPLHGGETIGHELGLVCGERVPTLPTRLPGVSRVSLAELVADRQEPAE